MLQTASTRPSSFVRASAAGAGSRSYHAQRSEPAGLPSGKPRGRLAPERAIASSAAAGAEPAPAAEALPPGHTPHRSISVLNRYRALLLDSTYRPVGVANWQRAVCLDLMDKADVLEYFDATVRSVEEEFYLPAVLRVRTARSRAHRSSVSLSRANILLRDRYSCQYCGSGKELTIDHVVPQSKGGLNTWDNLVACCAKCNSKKGDKSLAQLRWKLRQEPKEPSIHELDFLLHSLCGCASQESLPQEWHAYILPFSTRKQRQHAG